MVELDRFDNSWYHPGRSKFIQVLWFFFGLPILRSPLLPSSAVRCRLLRLFGAQVGKGVVIKPGVRVKYPWLLSIGANSWIGEDCWIDNLAPVDIGRNVCVSQGVYFCTGNHNWSDPAFGLMVRPITLRDGCWVAAKAVLCPGIEIGECAVVGAGSVAIRDVPAYQIWTGNPAVFRKLRPLNQTSVADGGSSTS
jgi:putative colanic acid biosynthesis acetyltransferase WcaF